MSSVLPTLHLVARSSKLALSMAGLAIAIILTAGLNACQQKLTPTAVLSTDAEYDERTTPTPAGNRVLVEADNGRLVLFIDSRRYLLPDVLWAANEMRDRCACAISNLAGNRLTVQLKPHEEGAAPGPLCEEFERWLNAAVERSR